MPTSDVMHLLSSIGQKHLSYGLELISDKEQAEFYNELQRYQPLLKSQRDVLKKPLDIKTEIEPWNEYEPCKEQDRSAGDALLTSGKGGCLIVAGGLGSRLGASVPKGTIGVSPAKDKSLFQLFLERTLAASRRYQCNLKVAIMTSPSNHLETTQFLSDHQWFGLDKEQVDIFCQEELPFCDDGGNWLLQAPGKLAKGPDGNGNALLLFYKSGIFEKWRQSGVEHLNVIQVDNALADPFDPIFFGFHSRKQEEVSIKSILKEQADEKLGVIASYKEKLTVIEYSELPPSTRFSLASIGLFCFSFDFIERLTLGKREMPWHLSYKEAPIWDGSFKKQKVWKFEHFLFDVFSESSRIAVTLAPRELCYAALKNASGEKSIVTVKEALIHSAKSQYELITGKKAPETLLELDPAFYYLTAEQKEICKHASWPQLSYLEPPRL